MAAAEPAAALSDTESPRMLDLAAQEVRRTLRDGMTASNAVGAADGPGLKGHPAGRETAGNENAARRGGVLRRTPGAERVRGGVRRAPLPEPPRPAASPTPR